MRVFRTTLPLLALAVLLAACASRAGARLEGEPEALTIEVTDAPTSFTLYLVQGTGNRKLLGTVEAGREVIFVYRDVEHLENYRLIAYTAAGGAVRSRGFSPFSRGTIIRWDLNANYLSLRPVAPEDDREG